MDNKRVYEVTLKLAVPLEDGKPERWDWAELLDMDFNDVSLESVKEL